MPAITRLCLLHSAAKPPNSIFLAYSLSSVESSKIPRSNYFAPISAVLISSRLWPMNRYSPDFVYRSPIYFNYNEAIHTEREGVLDEIEQTIDE